MNTIQFVYGIVFPILCTIIFAILLKDNSVIEGLVAYSIGILIGFPALINPTSFRNFMNS